MITGPFEDSWNNYVTGRAQRIKRWRQTPPYVRPLPYQHGFYQGTFTANGVVSPFVWNGGPVFRNSTQTVAFPEQDFAYAKAYHKIHSAIHDTTAQLGLAAVEVSESLKMIWTRAGDLLGFLRSLNKGDLAGVLRHLGVVGAKRKRATSVMRRVVKTKSAQASSAYLEFIFGWKPMIEDIYNAVSVLQKSFRAISVKEGGKGTVHSKTTVPFGPQGWETLFYQVTTRVRLGCLIEISNPNLALANSLGLVNPAQVAWGALPGSFLLNWFLPIERFLGTFSTFWGYDVRDAYFSRKCDSSYTRTSSFNGWAGRGLEITEDRGHQFIRDLVPSFYPPRLYGKLPVENLLGRAQSVAALVVQQLSSKR